jgi:hypothetical protein
MRLPFSPRRAALMPNFSRLLSRRRKGQKALHSVAGLPRLCRFKSSLPPSNSSAITWTKPLWTKRASDPSSPRDCQNTILRQQTPPPQPAMRSLFRALYSLNGEGVRTFVRCPRHYLKWKRNPLEKLRNPQFSNYLWMVIGPENWSGGRRTPELHYFDPRGKSVRSESELIRYSK